METQKIIEQLELERAQTQKMITDLTRHAEHVNQALLAISQINGLRDSVSEKLKSRPVEATARTNWAGGPTIASRITSAIAESGGTADFKRIVELTGAPYTSASVVLSKMAKAGKLRRVAMGRYALPSVRVSQ